MDTAATRPTAKRKRRRRVRSVRNKVDSAGDENDSDHLTVRNARLDADATGVEGDSLPHKNDGRIALLATGVAQLKEPGNTSEKGRTNYLFLGKLCSVWKKNP